MLETIETIDVRDIPVVPVDVRDIPVVFLLETMNNIGLQQLRREVLDTFHLSCILQ